MIFLFFLALERIAVYIWLDETRGTIVKREEEIKITHQESKDNQSGQMAALKVEIAKLQTENEMFKKSNKKR